MKTITALFTVIVAMVLASCADPRYTRFFGEPVEPGTALTGTVVKGNSRPDPLDPEGGVVFTGALNVPAPEVEPEGGE